MSTGTEGELFLELIEFARLLAARVARGSSPGCTLLDSFRAIGDPRVREMVIEEELQDLVGLNRGGVAEKSRRSAVASVSSSEIPDGGLKLLDWVSRFPVEERAKVLSTVVPDSMQTWIDKQGNVNPAELRRRGLTDKAISKAIRLSGK